MANISLMGSGVPHGLVPDVLFPRTPALATPNARLDGEMTDGVREQIAKTLREFGFNPKGRAKVYQKSYPDYFDTFLTQGILGCLILPNSLVMILGLHMSIWGNSWCR
jgi:hypothetical protein